MIAADRDPIGMHEPPAGEDADGRGAGAEIDDDRAHLGFVVDERRETAGEGRGDHALDLDMAALDGEHEIAHRGHIGGDHRHADAQRLADHAARITHAVHVVERKARRQGMHHGPAGP